MNPEVAALAVEIDALLAALAVDGLDDPARVDEIADRTVEVARGASEENQRMLLDRLVQLEQAVLAAQQRLGAALREVGDRRRAVTGYGALRPHEVGQRLLTKI